jgi:tetratricopeptide (TPR) repeat protein
MKRIFYLLSIFLLISCGNSKNTPEFIEATQGRYLFNSNEAIEISYVEGVMNVNWRDQNISPIKLNDSAFFVKEMNEKLVFIASPEMHIKLAEKREHEGKKYVFTKLKEGQKTPREYFDNKEYGKALEAYKLIQKKDSTDENIQWWNINQTAHRYYSDNQKDKAFELFKINIELYPNDPASYRNYGWSLMQEKDTVGAKENYRKALSINPDDQRALAFFERLQKSGNE